MSPRGEGRNADMRAGALARISRAALEVFAEYGYHGATMKRIAEASGLSYGLVYHYYPSKEAVFRKLLGYALEGPLAAMEATLDRPGPAWEGIERLSRRLAGAAFSGESSRYFFIVTQALSLGEGIPGLPRDIEDHLAAYYRALVPAIERAQAEGDAAAGDPGTLAAAYFALVQGLALLSFQQRGLERRISPEILCSVLRRPAARNPRGPSADA